MRPITFNKVIILKNMRIGVENIYIEDNFNYSMDGNDLKILGKITIKYLVNDGLNKKEAETDIHVDCVLTLAKIDCKKDLSLRFKDYKVIMDEHLLRFYLHYDLVGNGEKIISFQEIAPCMKEEKIIAAMNKNYENKIDKESIAKIQELLKDEDVEVITTLPLEKKEETQIKTKNDEQEEQKIIKEYDNKEIKLKNTKKESYKITYFLYKVRENDTYESIAKIFSVDAEDVKKINNYENLYPGKLVRLKK